MSENIFNMGYKIPSKQYSDASEPIGSEVFFNNLIWGIDEVCSFTAYKKGTIYNLVSNGDIPYRKRGKRLFFIPTEILKWIKGE